MLRAVLVGLLSVSAVGCKTSGDSPASQPGVAAGKVVEVSGTVMVRHDDVAQPLAKGATIEADDVIETGADGNVIIELSHNLARWEIGPNKTSKVRESVAWGLAKKTGDTTTVDENTAAAGRPAERSAAGTSVTASAEAAPAAPVAPSAAAAAVPAPEPSAGAPPPPPAPVRQVTPPKKVAPLEQAKDMGAASGGGAKGTRGAGATLGATGSVGGEGGGGAVAPSDGVITRERAAAPAPGGGAANATSDAESAKPMSPADADKAAMDVVLANDKKLKACLTKDAQAVSVTIKVAANGKATAVVSAKATVPSGVQTCIKTAVGKMAFAKAATTVTVQVER